MRPGLHVWGVVMRHLSGRAFNPARQHFAIPNRIENMYSAQVLDHFQHPRNAGEIAEADAAAEIENPACGDVLRVTIKIDGERIADIRFKAKGCVPSIACASALTELVQGKSVSEAQALGRENLIQFLGGLPQASTHAAQLALDTLSAALRTLCKSNDVAVHSPIRR